MSDSLGRSGFALGGAAIGSFFGVPGIGLAVGGLVGGLLFPGSDPPTQPGPRLGDMQAQVSAYGTPMPILYGTQRVAGNVIWAEDIKEVAHTETMRRTHSSSKQCSRTRVSYTHPRSPGGS